MIITLASASPRRKELISEIKDLQANIVPACGEEKAIFMNAGAYDGEIKDIAESVTVLTRSGEIRTYKNAELDFGYRHSRLQDEDDIVLEATFLLKHGDKEKIHARMEELSFLRASKQPLEYPSCGSVFKRPVGHYTGKLVHDANLQGFTIGGAQVLGRSPRP